MSVKDIEYQIAYSASLWEFQDRSFLVEENGHPYLGACLALGRNPAQALAFSGFGRPVKYFAPEVVDGVRFQGAVRCLREHVHKLLHQYAMAPLHFREYGPVISPLGRFLLDYGATAQPFFTQRIHLQVPESQLHALLRKSYKSLVNTAGKWMEIEVLDKNNFTDEALEEFRQLHILAAGKVTRSFRSWQIQAEMIRGGQAFLVTGRVQGSLRAAALFLHTVKYCYYGVAAVHPAWQHKPLGHGILWAGLMHARRIGCIYFETGEQIFPCMQAPEKARDIAHFKKGFGGETHLQLDLYLPVRHLTGSVVAAESAGPAGGADES